MVGKSERAVGGGDGGEGLRAAVADFEVGVIEAEEETLSGARAPAMGEDAGNTASDGERSGGGEQMVEQLARVFLREGAEGANRKEVEVRRGEERDDGRHEERVEAGAGLQDAVGAPRVAGGQLAQVSDRIPRPAGGGGGLLGEPGEGDGGVDTAAEVTEFEVTGAAEQVAFEELDVGMFEAQGEPDAGYAEEDGGSQNGLAGEGRNGEEQKADKGRGQAVAEAVEADIDERSGGAFGTGWDGCGEEFVAGAEEGIAKDVFAAAGNTDGRETGEDHGGEGAEGSGGG